MNIERKTHRNAIHQKTAQSASNDGFELCQCSLCGAEISAAYQSNDPYPFGNEGDKCCHTCNLTKVIPERLGLRGKEREEYIQQMLHASAKQEAA
jgi:hypothetical protein